MKYKLIKEYPNGPKLNTIINRKITGEDYWSYNNSSVVLFAKDHPENYPEFWEEVTEYKCGQLCYRIWNNGEKSLGKFIIYKYNDSNTNADVKPTHFYALEDYEKEGRVNKNQSYGLGEYKYEIVEKDYEILSCKYIKPNNWLHDYRNGDIVNIKSENDTLTFQKKNGDWDRYSGYDGFTGPITKTFSIYSIKRLSDGEIFTISDKITLEGHIIHEFELVDNKLKVWDIHPSYSCPIKPKDDRSVTSGNMSFNWLKDVKKIKTPLFTTEDGVDIFEQNITLYGVHKETLSFNKSLWNLYITNYYIDKYYWFSKKEKAEEYILLNKPCLSINDVAKVFVSTNYTTNKGNIYPQGQKLRDLVKSKITIM